MPSHCKFVNNPWTRITTHTMGTPHNKSRKYTQSSSVVNLCSDKYKFSHTTRFKSIQGMQTFRQGCPCTQAHIHTTLKCAA